MGRLSLAMNLVPGLHTSCSRPDVLSTVGTKNSQLCPSALLLEPGVLALSTVLSLSQPPWLTLHYIQEAGCAQYREAVHLNLPFSWNWKFLLLWLFSKPRKTLLVFDAEICSGQSETQLNDKPSINQTVVKIVGSVQVEYVLLLLLLELFFHWIESF